MTEKFTQSPGFYRFGEIAVPALTWILILLPVWLSPFHPAVVAYFIIAFDLYFFYKSLTTTYYAVVSYRTIEVVSKINFAKKLKSFTGGEEIQHFIIIPNYSEPIYKLESSIESFVENDIPYKNLHLVLAFEDREVEAREKEKILRNRFGRYFKDIISSYHVLSIGEVAGKASNQTYAAKIVDTYTQEKGYLRENCLITICDADSHLSKNYFSYLTLEYLKDENRQYHFYWAPVLLYNNFWQLPFFVRIQATLSSIVRLAFLSQREKLIQISTYSTSLWLLNKVGYWHVDIIPEDWHIYYQAFFEFGDKVRTIPLFTITNGDAVYSGSIIKTLLNRYDQERRWAWGVTDVAYIWKKFFTSKEIPYSIKLRKLLYLAETHLLWPTSFFILTISASIPPLINPLFKRTVLGFILPQASGLILTLASIMLLLYIYLDFQIRNKMNIKTKIINVPFLLIQWYLLPLVSFVLSSLPALDAHTRLILGKKITYKVTEKV